METDWGGCLSSDEDARTPAISFHHRRKGPKQPRLDILVSYDEIFDRLIYNRYENLLNTRPTRKQKWKTRLHKTRKKIELKMNDHKFTCEDHVLVFDFLTRVVREDEMIGMSEG